MNHRALECKEELRSIARRAMVQRGLLPDFPPAAKAEADAITRAATAGATDPPIRDERGRLWASIDNLSRAAW